MPGTDLQRVAIDPGFIRYVISGDQTANFGPGQPLQPLGQGAFGRQFDYPVYYNTQQVPRAYEPVDFPQLRAFADAEYLTRLAIETRKDQMGKLEWNIVRDDGGDPDATCEMITEMLEYPDREHDFMTWQRMVLEDLLVIDAAACCPRKTKGGKLYSLDLIDGATIARKLESGGRTPIAPDPAYQQIIKGLPYVDYSTDELIYQPRNARTFKVYGYSPVQQILLMLNIALRREVSQLQFYTAGNVPDSVWTTPAGWTSKQLKDAQQTLDEMLSGDTAKRRQVMLMPGETKPYELKPYSQLFDAFSEEWVARVVSSAFNLPPSAYVKQQNRATQQTAQEVALEEGLAPIMGWFVRFMKRNLKIGFGVKGYSYAWKQESDIDPLVQAQIDQIYLGGATGQGKMARTIQEVRDDHNWGPEPPELDEINNPPAPEPLPAVGPAEPAKPKEAPETAEKLAKIAETVDRILATPAPQPMPSITLNTPQPRASRVTLVECESRRERRRIVAKRAPDGSLDIRDPSSHRKMVFSTNPETHEVEMRWAEDKVSA